MTTTAGPAGLREPEAGTRRPFQDAITAADTLTPARPDQQQDMTGGWRRRPLLGAMAGLVTSTSLIAGVGGGAMSSHITVLAGLAGLAARRCPWPPASTWRCRRITNSSGNGPASRPWNCCSAPMRKKKSWGQTVALSA